jgi:hypothetical protein
LKHGAYSLLQNTLSQAGEQLAAGKFVRARRGGWRAEDT